MNRTHERLTATTFVLPALSVIALCVLLPMLLALALAFTRCSQFLTISWAGLDNFQRLLHDTRALKALGNTCFYTVVFVPLNLALSLAIALLLNRQFPGIRLIRSAFFLPVAISGVVTISIFNFIFDRNYGPLNALLQSLGLAPVAWLWDKDLAMWSIILMSLWKSTAFFSIILLAALQDVPAELHEAATVDGAGAWSRFWNVTLPSIRSVVWTVALISTIGCFRVFEPMFVLTKGGPSDSTRTVALLAYDAAFGEGQLGYATAISLCLLIIIVVVTLVLNRVTKEK